MSVRVVSRVVGCARRWAFAAATAALLANSPAFALSLEESMIRASVKNPEFAAEQQRALAVRQGIAIARAPGLPQIQLTANARSYDLEDPQNRRRGNFETEDWAAGGTLSQLVYASGRVGADVRAARAESQSANWRVEEARQALLLDVARAYADVIRTRAVLDAQVKSIETLEAQRAYVVANRRGGFLTDTDLAQADGRLAQAVAQASRARAEVAGAEQAFVRVVGERPDTLAAPPSVAGLPETLDSALAFAFAQRAVLKANEASVKAAEAAVRSAIAEGRPRITLEGSTEAFGALRNADFDGSDEEFLTMRLSVPLFSGGAPRARTSQQRFQRNAAQYDLRAAQLRVREDVIGAWARLEAARSALDAAQRQTAASELALKGVRREQENGLRSVIDVLDQERDLLQARVALAIAERDVTVTEREVLFTIGSLRVTSSDPAARPVRTPSPRPAYSGRPAP